LERHPEVTNYVIIDDTHEFHLPGQKEHFIQPDAGDGFGYDDFIKARKILGGKTSPIILM
jgi:hypothetical protein